MTSLNKADGRLLRLNVGFLLKESAGYSREFVFDEPGSFLAEDLTVSHLHGMLRLTRTPQGILVQGKLQAQTPVECTRCLTPYQLDYQVELSDLFTYLTTPPEANNLYMIDEGGYIDFTPILREEGILAIPMQALCRPDCKGLCSECGQNLNEGSCQCAQDRIDPRLASLRALLEE